MAFKCRQGVQPIIQQEGVDSLGASKDWAMKGCVRDLSGLAGDGIKRDEPVTSQFGPELVECGFPALKEKFSLLDYCMNEDCFYYCSYKK